ncbi:homogentisate 1,2-dioxygenase [Pseudomonas sp. PA15(2017)]|uniref:homogentisate 1,2-dioxygenase n=1 Tax=Pseudomonas sp. PA15(2017) TaxID=1932111 RepID=UPI00095AE4D8|nr:homogentisate 1,2-dioxygenase [Pseudomonas sp. PA15(2017)]OLU27398.1 homogentisate 1,2-dioxygenase [Pseudomonas sp. PA15(2017)]
MSRKWISFPLREGEHSRQAHCDFPAGTYEREMGREGFFGPVTHLHHKHPPTGWIDWQGPLRPHAFNFNRIASAHDCPFEAPLTLHNADIRLRVWKTATAMGHLVRNSDGDELLFVHDGAGHFHCDFGHLEYRDGDYLVIPRGTAWRVEPTAPSHFLLVENTDGAYQLPDKGLLGGQAIFDPAVLDHPHIDDAFKAQQDENTWQIRIKRQGRISTVTYPYNPLDAVGWHGDNTVVRLNWRDIRPLMSHRYHLPPSVHTTFVAKGFVVCTFTPRPVESDPGALKVPFFHNNDDYDEVLFYHRGNFFSRDNIEAGMVTLHPCGFPHGPHPKALKKAQTDPATFAEEVAVMIDTRRALEVTDAAAAVDVAEYVNSWRAPGKES